MCAQTHVHTVSEVAHQSFSVLENTYNLCHSSNLSITLAAVKAFQHQTVLTRWTVLTGHAMMLPAKKLELIIGPCACTLVSHAYLAHMPTWFTCTLVSHAHLVQSHEVTHTWSAH